ncbi:MAG: hypothetical protein K8R85_01765 [Bacteroidetes bacterium]|nr:hypothetical protein [Bacteroidota bacterium]
MNCSYLGTLQWQYSSDQATWLTIIGATFDTLKVIPSNTSYYRAAIASGTCNIVYSDTAVIVSSAGTYSLTQIVNGCSSSIGSATALPIIIPPAPTVAVIDNCGSSTLTANGFTGALLWSNAQTLNSISVNSAGNYTVSQTVNGCISAAGSGTASPTAVPSIANAGSDINLACGINIATLAGNSPTIGTGAWSIVSGTATITNSGSPISGVTGLIEPGLVTLSWTISNAPCASSVDNVIITVNSIPLAPTAGAATPTKTTIVWNWNTVSGATGYKFNTVNNYSTATDNLANLSYTQTGLTCNTIYTLYIWAYNGCGNSSVTTLTQTTESCCVANVGAVCDKGGWTSVACDPAKCVTAKVNCGEHVTKHCYPLAPLSAYWEPAWTYSTDCTVAQYTYFNDPPCSTNVWVSDMSGVIQCDGACQ